MVPSQIGLPNHQAEAMLDDTALLSLPERDRDKAFRVILHGDGFARSAKLDDARLGEAHRLAVHLLGDGPAPLIREMIDGGPRPRREHHALRLSGSVA